MTASHNTELPRQRVEEWLEGCDWDLHEKQFKTPYRLTVHFFNWLLGLGCLKSKQPLRIGDIGAGMGAVIYYFGKRCRDAEFVGLEINPECVRRGNERLAALGAKNCRLKVFNLYDSYPRQEPVFDGLMSCALLSWLPDLKEALKKITALNPGWIAASSLFYDGPVDCIIETRDGSRPLASAAYTTKFYNIYSLKTTREILMEFGYAEFQSTPFQIDVDLSQPAAKGLGTFTEKMSDGRRLQISGPLLMPWHFIYARRK